MKQRSEEVKTSDVKKAYWNTIEANIKLQDENKVLNARIIKLNKVINELLEKIMNLEMEIEKYESSNIQGKVR